MLKRFYAGGHLMGIFIGLKPGSSDQLRRAGKEMNFNDRKTRRRLAIVIIVVIVAMVATTVLPYMVS